MTSPTAENAQHPPSASISLPRRPICTPRRQDTTAKKVATSISSLTELATAAAAAASMLPEMLRAMTGDKLSLLPNNNDESFST